MDNDLAAYQTQLSTVKKALVMTTAPEERAALEALQSDLMELLELTRQTAEVTKSEKENKFDDEMERFRSEIEEIAAKESEDEVAEKADPISDEDVQEQLQELKSKLESMVGQKCSAPHQHTWGSFTYHNAIVCGIENTVEVNNDGLLDARLRILFTNPTHREMVPCSYYLEGECRFDAERCHYSHGELVAPAQLRDYVEPDFERLARNCVVLAKCNDRLWHRGRVLCANFVEQTCRVRLEGKLEKEREQDFVFEDLFPIFHDEDLSSGSSSANSDDSANESEELDDFKAAKQACLVEQTLFTFRPSQALGEWEKHTRGIGSKLMTKMGYVHGTGLGSDARGIVTPVTAQILPQGCSLDHCMKLREAANGDKNLFSVEKKLRRSQKKQEMQNEKAYAREVQRVDVFSFLNDSILSGRPTTTTNDNSTPSLQSQTTKSLNVQSMRIADRIARKEREISVVQQSIRRNADGSDVHKRLQMQLSARTDELYALQREEKCLNKEQATRRSKDKLSVF